MPLPDSDVPGLALVVLDGEGRAVRANARGAALLARGLDPALLAGPGGAAPLEREFEGDRLRIFLSPLSPAPAPGAERDAAGRPLRHAYIDVVKTIGAAEQRGIESTLRYQNGILLGLAKDAAIDSGDLDAAVKLVTEAGAAGLRCARCAVWLYGADRTRIRCLDLYHYELGRHEQGGELLARDFPAYFAALAEDRTIAASDACTHPATREFADGHLRPQGITSMLVAPIREHGHFLGVVCNEHIGPPTSFSQEEQNFAAAIADIVSRVLQAAERRRAETMLQEAHGRLEAEVRARTAALQLALDSMGDGLLLCERTGALSAELPPSRTAAEWFGPCAAGLLLWDYLAPAGSDAALREAWQRGFAAIAAGSQPFERAARQLPAQIKARGRDIHLDYRQLAGDECPGAARVVVIARDVTIGLLRERSEQARRELCTLLGHVVQDRRRFAAFIDEAGRRLRRFADLGRSRDDRLQHLSQLRGAVAVYGLQSFAAACRDLYELALSDSQRALCAESTAEILQQWSALTEPLRSFLQIEEESVVRIPLDAYRDLLLRLESGEDPERLLAPCRGWHPEAASGTGKKK